MKTITNTQIENSVDIHQHVTFQINRETFGIDVHRVKEVLYLIDITEIPNSLPFMKGVIDLRGAVVPVIDTRIKFNISEKKYTDDTVIIITEFSSRQIGLIVDSVHDVMDISSEEYQQTVNFSEEKKRDYIRAIVKTEETLVMILELDMIFSEDELQMLRQGMQ